MSDFRFADPHFVHALWAVLGLVAGLFWLDQRGGTALESLVGPALADRLVTRPGPWRRRLRIALLGLAVVCAVLALMRPQWGMRVVPTSRVGARIMIALDVSRSMLAEDVAPNRLDRAKAEIVDLLSYMDGDQVGLIAFAGRASVVSPLTPDFGFLRLVLDETGPGSVTRGGTKLAEPIRKAVEGFGPSEGVSRAILLITDGEDHDSFALDAAREAAEAGVKIIAIGFGDEGGSEISVTDPRSGARRLLRDPDGRPVRSRLDGDLLRSLALATDGAYVPAGTGVLDLESIYDEHIARLTRDSLDGARSVREEGYPWFILLALVFLVSSAAVSAGRVRGSVAAALLLFALLPVPPARAQQPGEPAVPLATPGVPPDPGLEAAAAEAVQGVPAASPIEDPRDIYNQGVAALSRGSFEDAERELSRARRDARADDELRFHASYNLGWVTVQQAGRVQGEAPQQALALLYRAADWFREAVRLRAEDDEARHNLEVTLKRALVLADEIARGTAGGVEGMLAELAERQRAVMAGVARLLEAAHLAGIDPLDGGEGLRGEFRAHATAQRAVLSDADQLAEQVAGERDGLEARPDEERAPEDGMRVAQLSNVLGYLHRARERMGQARRQLRQRQGTRAYRRTSAALVELKRAQDQLRDPVAALGQLLSDGTELARGAALLSLNETPGGPPDMIVPPWLEVETVAEGQSALAERASELQLRFAAGLEHSGADPAGLSPEQAALLESVREAEPLVGTGSEHAGIAAEALAAASFEGVAENQGRSLAALADARERFLDVPGLIEAIYAEEQQIANVVSVDAPGDDERRSEFLPVLRAVQRKNVERGGRLAEKLEANAAALDALSAASEEGTLDPNTEPPDPERLEEDRQHLQIASQILTLALAGMEGVRDGLGADDKQPETVDWDWVESDAAKSIEHLETLRRLFFSIVEHLRDVARRQVDLADRTQDALARAASPDVDPLAESGPLIAGEQGLAGQTLVIANALVEQSSAAGDPADPQAGEASARLREAADHVLLAQGEMEGAVSSLEAPDLESARAAQGVALEELALALAILEPPDSGGEQGDDSEQQQEQEQGEQQADEQGGDQGQQGQPDQQGEQQEQAGLGEDPGQLLQEVRDREAQRRRERANRSAPYETVEKDW